MDIRGGALVMFVREIWRGWGVRFYSGDIRGFGWFCSGDRKLFLVF